MSAVYVYILQCADGTFYTGWTTDLARRLATHNAGRGSYYTRLRRPVYLVYWEDLPDRASAQQRELQVKRLPRAWKLALVEGFDSGRHRGSPLSSQGGGDAAAAGTQPACDSPLR